jgi:hypothetical protein
MADLTLNQTKRAPILNESDTQIVDSKYSALSADPGIASISNISHLLSLVGVTGGTTNVTVTRTLDGSTVTHSVEVVAAAPFDWHLGSEVAA